MDSNVAQSNPEKFACMLSEKLQRIKDERDKYERITTSLHNIDVSAVPSVSTIAISGY